MSVTENYHTQIIEFIEEFPNCRRSDIQRLGIPKKIIDSHIQFMISTGKVLQESTKNANGTFASRLRMARDERVLATQAGSGDVTPAADAAPTSLAACTTGAGQAVAEPLPPDDSPVGARSDEIGMEEIFAFDLNGLDAEDDTDEPAFRRHANRIVCTASSDGQVTFHRFGDTGLVLTAAEVRTVYEFLANSATIWGAALK